MATTRQKKLPQDAQKAPETPLGGFEPSVAISSF
jgi:hypothetical protein